MSRLLDGLVEAIDNLGDWWTKRTCEHWWRPARTSQGLARHCPWCDSTEQLSQEMFYAYFGRIQ